MNEDFKSFPQLDFSKLGPLVWNFQYLFFLQNRLLLGDGGQLLQPLLQDDGGQRVLPDFSAQPPIELRRASQV